MFGEKLELGNLKHLDVGAAFDQRCPHILADLIEFKPPQSPGAYFCVLGGGGQGDESGREGWRTCGHTHECH